MLGVGEDQTSRQATGWSLPALLCRSSFSSPTSLHLSSFSFHLDLLSFSQSPSTSLCLFLSITPSLFLSLISLFLFLSPSISVTLSPPYYSYFHAHVPRTAYACGSTIALTVSCCGAQVGTCNLRRLRRGNIVEETRASLLPDPNAT